jgi:hypothetical protein
MDEPSQPDSYEQLVRSRLEAAVARVRHPALTLGYFTAGTDGDRDDHDDGEDDEVPAEERESAALRRAALLVAALDIIDSCIGDLQILDFGEDQLPDEEEAEDSFVYEWFPKRHRSAYDEDFFRKTLVTAVKVANDFANPDGGPAACTAEELIRHAAGVIAGDLCEDAA